MARTKGSTLGWVDRIVRWVGAGMLAAVLVSALWVLSLRWSNQAEETFLMAARESEGVVITQEWRRLDQISPHLVRAVIASEDAKFCDHFGFDVDQIRFAIADAQNGGRLRGASTISQQTSKNVFLWPGRSMVRKGLEAWFTVLSETFWTKARMMEIYLNIAEWGNGAFGAEAAAQLYFEKPAADLTAAEASLLAVILPSPNEWSIDPAGPYVTSRSRIIRRRMAMIREQGGDACVYPN